MTPEQDQEMIALRGMCNRLRFGFMFVVATTQKWPTRYRCVANSVGADLIYGWIRPMANGTYAQAMGYQSEQDALDSAEADSKTRALRPICEGNPIRPSRATPAQLAQATAWIVNQAAILRRSEAGMPRGGSSQRSLRRSIGTLEREARALQELQISGA